MPDLFSDLTAAVEQRCPPFRCTRVPPLAIIEQVVNDERVNGGMSGLVLADLFPRLPHFGHELTLLLDQAG